MRLLDLPAATELAVEDALWLADMSASVGSRDRVATLADLIAFLFELTGGLIPRGDTSSRPAGATAGNARLYFDTDLSKVIVHDGTNWVNLDGSSL